MVVLLVLGFLWLLSQCGSSDSTDKSATGEEKPAATREPSAEKYMPGDGTFPMGGIDGRNWGIWESDGKGGSRGCEWSIRAVSRYDAAEILDSGDAPPGKVVRVSIQPDGEVGISGQINGRRLVFQTSGCGSWRIAN